MLSTFCARRRPHDDGFTLIELLVVVIIIGLLAAIALPIFINQQKQAVEASVKSDVRNTVANVNNWLVDNRGTAFNSSTFVTKGGKIAQSRSDTVVTVKGSTDGTYLVCAYNPGASTSATKANPWGFDAASGKFAQATAGCADTFGIDYANGFDAATAPSSNAAYAFTDFRLAHYNSVNSTRYGYPTLTLTPTAVGYAAPPMARITGTGDWSSTFDYLAQVNPTTTNVSTEYSVGNSLRNVNLTVDGATYTSTNLRFIFQYNAFKSGTTAPSVFGFPAALQDKDVISVNVVLQDAATVFPSSAVRDAFYDHGTFSFDFKPIMSNGSAASTFVTKTYSMQNGF